jgi:hypothetical protein
MTSKAAIQTTEGQTKGGPMPLRTGDQTAGMLVMDSRLGGPGELARFIAERRMPGNDWRSFEQIADELCVATGIQVSRPGVEQWAERLGIPATNSGDFGKVAEAYRSAVEKYLRAPRGESTA